MSVHRNSLCCQCDLQYLVKVGQGHVMLREEANRMFSLKSRRTLTDFYGLTPSTPAVPNCCCSKRSVPYWSNPVFLIVDIRALWRSGLSARAPECQKLKIPG